MRNRWGAKDIIIGVLVTAAGLLFYYYAYTHPTLYLTVLDEPLNGILFFIAGSLASFLFGIPYMLVSHLIFLFGTRVLQIPLDEQNGEVSIGHILGYITLSVIFRQHWITAIVGSVVLAYIHFALNRIRHK